MKFAFIVVFGILNIVGAEIAALELASAREKDPKAECEYRSIASFSPGRVAVCELWRKRW